MTPEPGDDKGGLTDAVEPGDDKGGLRVTPEPGDDKGGSRAPEPGDDSGGHSGRGGGERLNLGHWTAWIRRYSGHKKVSFPYAGGIPLRSRTLLQ